MEDPKFACTTVIDIIVVNAVGKAFANMEKTSIAAKNVEALNFVSTTSINITAKNAFGTAFPSITETNIYAKNAVGLPFANTGKINHNEENSALCLFMPIALSHDLRAFLNVLMHIDMLSGMYTTQGSDDILVRTCGSWEKIMVDQRRSWRIFKQVKQCVMPIALSHDLQAFLNVLMHIDIFCGMYTSQGSGDILVRTSGRWEKIMVEQRRSRRILKQVKQCVMPIYAYCALTRPTGISKCLHAYRHVQWDVH